MLIACIPALDEERTISAVVAKLRAAGFSGIVVFDNGSRDRTAAAARAAGAWVMPVLPRGKGVAMQAIFRYCVSRRAHAFVVDADDTYSLGNIRRHRRRFLSCSGEMLVGCRSRQCMQPSHRVGNCFFSMLLSFFHGHRLRDVLSGYRFIPLAAMRRIRLRLSDFRTETELTLRCLRQGIPIAEVPVGYRNRRWGGSKLCAFRDGLRILLLIVLGVSR